MVNLATLERAQEAYHQLKDLGLTTELVMVSAARGKGNGGWGHASRIPQSGVCRHRLARGIVSWSRIKSPAKLGCLFGVGVGPGDPELLTLKALRVIQAAPVICVPQSKTQQDSYALGIIRELLDLNNQEIVRFSFSYR